MSDGSPIRPRPNAAPASARSRAVSRANGPVAVLPGAVAYVPVSVVDQHRSAGLAFVPVSDLSPSELVAAWPDTSRSRTVAAFVRAAAAFPPAVSWGP